MEKYLKDDNNQQLMRLPEETIREIFRYLSFETLYFYLRNVCKKMKCYVDNFIDLGGIFFLEGYRRGRIQHSEVIYIIQTKNKQFKIFWRPVSFVPWSPVYFKNNKGEEHRCDDEWHYSVIDEKLVCCIHQRHRFLVYQCNIQNGKWSRIAEKHTFFECLDQNEPTKHCHPIVFPEDSTVYDENSFYYLPIDYPFLRLKTESNINGTCEAMFCRFSMTLNLPNELAPLSNFSVLRVGPQDLIIVGGIKGIWREDMCPKASLRNDLSINRHVFQVELGNEGYNIKWKSKYLDDMPLRSRPLCFKLKNTLYIAGHNPLNKPFYKQLYRKEPQLFCSRCDSRFITKAKEGCTCCDKLDLTSEKYYRKICTLPRPLRYISNPKVTTNKKESMAIIHFYDAEDCQEKIWIFSEKDEQFEEHLDPNSKICHRCKFEGTYKRLVIERRLRFHATHEYGKKQLLRIQ